MPSSLFIRSMPKSHCWLIHRLSTCFLSRKENAEYVIQNQFQAQLLSARQVSNALADSTVDNCMPLQASVEAGCYSHNPWPVSSPAGSEFSLWASRSQNDCIIYLSSA